jgi:hypothetical protein
MASIIFFIVIIVLFSYFLFIERFIPYQELKKIEQEQNRENELIGMIFEPRAGPLIPSYPSTRPFTAIYKNYPYVVNYNKGTPMC